MFICGSLKGRRVAVRLPLRRPLAALVSARSRSLNVWLSDAVLRRLAFTLRAISQLITEWHSSSACALDRFLLGDFPSRLEHCSLSTLLLRRLHALLLLSLISSLPLSAIPLAQTQHSRLTHIGIAYKEPFQILRLHQCRDLHMLFVLHAVFRLRLSIRCADNYR
jgi:hypothetical protein